MEELVIYSSISVVALVCLECAYHVWRRTPNYDVRDFAANLAVAAISGVWVRLAWNALFAAAMAAAYSISPLRIPDGHWWYWPLIMLSSDLCYYVYHRVCHRCRLLWGAHVVHHSSEDLNLSTALRISWVVGSFRWLFWMPLPLLGFSPLHTTLTYFIIHFHQFWIHTRVFKSNAALDWFLNTPSHHRVHHGNNPEYLDKNYGGCFIIWDRLFGTFAKEEAPVTFGLSKPIKTYNPLAIIFGEYLRLGRDVWTARRWSDKWRYLFKPPSWSARGNVSSLPVGERRRPR